MRRKLTREHIFKLLFQIEFNDKDEIPYLEEMFFELDADDVDDKEKNYISEKFNLIREKLPELDSKLSENVTGWSIDRLGKVELAILRLALYEIHYDDTVPASVAINEAVEIAKKYGQDGAGAFVNGILAKFAKTE